MTDQIVRLMTQRENQLKKAVQKALRDTGDFPEGRLRSSSRNGKDRYYHVLDANDPDGKYIRRGDRILAQKLAQKEYNEEFIRRARGEIDAIHRMISKLADDGVKPFYIPPLRPSNFCILGRGKPLSRYISHQLRHSPPNQTGRLSASCS